MAKFVDNSNQLTPPAWAGDYFNREHMIPGGARVDPAQWVSTVYTITAPDGAASGATSFTVTATLVALPSGTVLDWTGTGELSKLSALAAAGSTTLYVTALDAAIESGDTAPYTVTDAVPVTIPSGTVVGRTIAERDAATAYGPAGDADDEVYLTCFDIYDASNNPDVELYRPNSIVKETFVPGWAALSAAVKAKLRAAYICTTGAA